MHVIIIIITILLLWVIKRKKKKETRRWRLRRLRWKAFSRGSDTSHRYSVSIYSSSSSSIAFVFTCMHGSKWDDFLFPILQRKKKMMKYRLVSQQMSSTWLISDGMDQRQSTITRAGYVYNNLFSCLFRCHTHKYLRICWCCCV